MLKNKQGIVFITALAMMFILLTLGMAYMMITRSETTITANQINALKVFYAAEAGVEHSIAELIAGTDVDGDGLGNVSGSLGSYSYAAAYDSAASKITSVGTAGILASRTIEVEINLGSFTGALQIAKNINANSTSGTITGNVDAGGNINLDSLVINGTVTEKKEDIIIPSPSFEDYKADADYTYSGKTTFASNPPDGIHYIDGNLTIKGNNITVNGTLVVTGNLIMNSAEGFTITPEGDYPAIVVGNNFNANSIEDSTFNGLIYVGNNATFNSWDNTQIVDGAIVSGNLLDLNSGPNVTINFNPSLDPPYFSGTGGITIASWQGHPSQ